MSFGYSQSLVFANKKADAKLIGVALGRMCIQFNISVRDVAETFGVSRVTVYSWFTGASNPRANVAKYIESYIRLNKNKRKLK